MNGIDVAVGKQIKRRRKALGLSQTELANRIGVKFQQVQKYKSGANRVAASRLWVIADALRVPLTFFFEDLEPAALADSPSTTAKERVPEAAELVKIFNRLPTAQKSAMTSFLRSLDELSETQHR